RGRQGDRLLQALPRSVSCVRRDRGGSQRTQQPGERVQRDWRKANGRSLRRGGFAAVDRGRQPERRGVPAESARDDLRRAGRESRRARVLPAIAAPEKGNPGAAYLGNPPEPGRSFSLDGRPSKGSRLVP